MDLTTLDTETLTERERIQLQPFHQAYSRKYPPAMTWRDCRAEGLEPKEYTKCGLVEIQESMDEIETLSSFHIAEDGTVQPGEGERASWMDRRINQWSRREIWSIH